MDENFEGERGFVGGALGVLDGVDFLDGIFAGEDDEFGAEFAGEFHAGVAGDGHLGGAVDGEVGGDFADETADAGVLDDGGVHARGDDGAQVVLGVGELVGEDEDVEGDVAADAALVEKLHERGEVGLREVFGAHAGVETLEAEVNGVGAILDGGAHALPVAGGGEQFRTHERAGCGRSGCGSGENGGHGRGANDALRGRRGKPGKFVTY